MKYYMGVDIGTTSVKVVAFSVEGEIVGRQQASYPMQHPEPDRSELDPEEIIRAVCGCINRAAAELLPSVPALISFSSAMHSFLAVDVSGHPLTACMIWADNRAGAIAEQLRDSARGMALYQATGVPIHAMTPLCKLLWLRSAEPEIFRKADKFMGIKEYIFYKLFGELVVDTSIASATGMLDIRTLEWDGGILDFLSILPAQLSRVVSPGHTLYYDGAGAEAAVRLRLPSGTPVVAGSSDGASANLATGAIGDHIMAITIGTSGAARMVIPGVQMDPHMRTFCYHVRGSSYISGGATNNGAVVIQWLKEDILQTEEDFSQLFAMAEKVAPGAEGLLFIPYILGERAPVWNSKARGLFFGLGIGHTNAHLIRAAMEGVIYCLYSIGKILVEDKEVRELHATGGFARSPLWLQVLANVFNTRVLVFGDDEGSALGAVVIGLEASGIPFSFPKKELTVYEPDLSVHAVYRKGFEKFTRIYQLVKEEFND
ncbi:MAG TPA: gluconokinase [Puia sp.]|nr:gluconokinase [Puia sp.]